MLAPPRRPGTDEFFPEGGSCTVQHSTIGTILAFRSLTPAGLTAMLRLVTRRALCTSVQVPTTPPAITSRVQQIFEDHSATSGLADNDTKFKVSTAC